jgi:molybdopterin-guanine dinucleotide biosynthesis protein A
VKAAVGIFVGGHSRRMGGQPKGLLVQEGLPLVERTARLAAALGDVVLVGRSEAYAHLGRPFVDDARAEAGPLGGLVALLAFAGQRSAIALACDLPRVSRGLLERLATEEPEAIALAPRSRGFWEPLFARYDAARALRLAREALDAGERSMQPLLDRLGARELSLDLAEREAIVDWDRPEDVDDLRV